MPSLDHNIMLSPLGVCSDDSRSISPVTPVFFKEARGLKLFRAISRKLGKLSNENISFFEDDSRSSSTDSCSLTSSERRCSRSQGRDSVFRYASPNHLSSSSSDLGSDIHTRHRHHHSSSAESLRQTFNNLELNNRSQSCTNSKDCKRKAAKKTTPKKILRSPVAYTYVKGLSGLPTQRVPKSCMSNYNTCGCNTFYMGLNR